jgi:hypothetical protein
MGAQQKALQSKSPREEKYLSKVKRFVCVRVCACVCVCVWSEV